MKPEEMGSWLLTEMEEFENRTPADTRLVRTNAEHEPRGTRECITEKGAQARS
jgi:hypothetical protein